MLKQKYSTAGLTSVRNILPPELSYHHKISEREKKKNCNLKCSICIHNFIVKLKIERLDLIIKGLVIEILIFFAFLQCKFCLLNFQQK